jgi:hypothetical protein
MLVPQLKEWEARLRTALQMSPKDVEGLLEFLLPLCLVQVFSTSPSSSLLKARFFIEFKTLQDCLL